MEKERVGIVKKMSDAEYRPSGNRAPMVHQKWSELLDLSFAKLFAIFSRHIKNLDDESYRIEIKFFC